MGAKLHGSDPSVKSQTEWEGLKSTSDVAYAHKLLHMHSTLVYYTICRIMDERTDIRWAVASTSSQTQGLEGSSWQILMVFFKFDPRSIPRCHTLNGLGYLGVEPYSVFDNLACQGDGYFRVCLLLLW